MHIKEKGKGLITQDRNSDADFKKYESTLKHRILL